MDLVFATNNKHKLEEVSAILGSNITIKSLKAIGCNDEIPETGMTLEDNALQKVHYIKSKFGEDCFADDTGLEVEALNNEPGVYSARYAGLGHDSEANMKKLLDNMQGIENRSARFRTVIALLLNDKEYLFEGIVKGTIIKQKKGTGGFGYDPIFVPEGYEKTFAELGEEVKNKISHRAIAVEKLNLFLSSLK